MKDRIVKMDGDNALVRDRYNMAIVNGDTKALEKYKKERETRLNAKEKQEKLENDVENMKSEMYEIKNILLNILEKMDK